jgi:peptidoglycan/LPS O-acetylase OafA/YrhL
MRTITDIRGTVASTHLDMVRGLAAIAVLAYHVRYRFFLDIADVEFRGVLVNTFYGMTSFGHDAVMVFFVLSGFLISSSIMRDCSLARWSWGRYLSSRLLRLYVVLLPGIVLTIVWDLIGLTIYDSHPIYTGDSQSWIHDFFPVGDRLSLEIVAGNLLFLQTIVVPPLGSNDALWSLAFEFWYYLLFPCIYLGLFMANRWAHRAVAVLAIAIIAAVIDKHILLYFPIWLLGVVACRLPPTPLLLNKPFRRVTTVAAAGLFLCLMVAGHLRPVKEFLGNSMIVMDYLTAVGFTSVLYVVLHYRESSRRGIYAAVAEHMAGMSYTLYVVHLPLLVFLRALLVPHVAWKPEPTTVAAAIGLCLFVIAYAIPIAIVTEARTDEWRRMLCGLREKMRFLRVARNNM